MNTACQARHRTLSFRSASDEFRDSMTVHRNDRVRPTAGDRRHDRPVHHPESGDPVHPPRRVEDGIGTGTHRGRAGKMLRRVSRQSADFYSATD